MGMKKKNIEIVAPLLNQSKKEIIEMGKKIGVPFEYTWSCYNGGRFPCQRCDSCRFRMRAFEQLGVYDPLMRRGVPVRTRLPQQRFVPASRGDVQQGSDKVRKK